MKTPKQFEKLFYPTTKVDMLTLLPEGYSVNENKAWGIQVETPTGPLIVNNVAKGYGMVNNSELLMPLYESLTKAFGELEIKVNCYRNAEFYVDMSIKEHKVSIQKGDIINPRIRWHNSYNSTIKHEVAFGALRLVCTNGMTLPVWDNKIKFRHTVNMKVRSIAQTVEKMAEFVDKFDEYTQGYKILAASKVEDINARIEEVVEATKFPIRQIEEVKDKVREEASLLGTGVNDWLIYNAFNFQLNHNSAIKTKDHKKEKTDQKILHYLLETI